MGAIPPERAGAAAKILAKPADYKVCEGCGSIVLKKALLCPNCHAYRFDESTPLVIKQAERRLQLTLFGYENPVG